MGSGSNVDLAVIKSNDQVEYLRGYDVANEKGVRKNKYEYPKGTTGVINMEKRPVIIEDVSVRKVEAGAEAMEA